MQAAQVPSPRAVTSDVRPNLRGKRGGEAGPTAPNPEQFHKYYSAMKQPYTFIRMRSSGAFKFWCRWSGSRSERYTLNVQVLNALPDPGALKSCMRGHIAFGRSPRPGIWISEGLSSGGFLISEGGIPRSMGGCPRNSDSEILGPVESQYAD